MLRPYVWAPYTQRLQTRNVHCSFPPNSTDYTAGCSPPNRDATCCNVNVIEYYS